ncbi:bifunctional phosphatase PAP2/diacylglycerol kinase family protein [Streptomyces sp. NPDC047886]|uniref:bifunctional phosphatase PAP2/diacylglycerol kinase family protein n=1 Tax=Streptomyces sp. NPDC047886 TaxID=3365490 RepID=UPI0037112D20
MGRVIDDLAVRRLLLRLHAVDVHAFDRVAGRAWPGAQAVLPRLTRTADHGVLWFGAAAGMWALGGVSGGRAAARGVASLALASATVNTLAKGAVRRRRPILDAVPVVRHLARQPLTSSFPSGHAASAAAFAAGVALESRRWGAVLLPVAVSVGFSRIYVGVHYPSDVLVGASLGVTAALATRALLPARGGPVAAVPPRADAPALPDGRGLVVVVNPSSGTQPQFADPADEVRAALPRAEVLPYDEGLGSLPDVLAYAARRAADQGGALGVCGGDGTVNAAVAPALRYGVPLLVLPGGTYNHFAADLGVETVRDACAAVAAGDAVRVDVGRVTPLRAHPGGAAAGPDPAYFVNTFSIGAYPELVRLRERWAPRVGGPLAGLMGVAHVLRTSRPVRAEVNGRRRALWVLFAGNGAYRSLGPAPTRRDDLADGLLDVRLFHGGPFARTRLLLTTLAGGLAHARVYAAAQTGRLDVGGLPEHTPMACDGEVVPAPAALRVDKLRRALTVYRPAGG